MISTNQRLVQNDINQSEASICVLTWEKMTQLLGLTTFAQVADLDAHVVIGSESSHLNINLLEDHLWQWSWCWSLGGCCLTGSWCRGGWIIRAKVWLGGVWSSKRIGATLVASCFLLIISNLSSELHTRNIGSLLLTILQQSHFNGCQVLVK